ncbi:MAG: hypothetical protein R3D98_12595 [Candidatus Krumholzibacteriia bacterium]
MSGFFSKDEILYEAFLGAGGFPWIWLVGFLAAGLTAFYMMRLMVMTFFGENRASDEVKKHLHESPLTMTLPLIVLAVRMSVAGGWVGIPAGMGGGAWLQAWLAPVFAGGHGRGGGPRRPRRQPRGPHAGADAGRGRASRSRCWA